MIAFIIDVFNKKKAARLCTKQPMFSDYSPRALQ